jgi:hypothetical protein
MQQDADFITADWKGKDKEMFFLRIANKRVSFTSCPSVHRVDMCRFQDIKQLLRLAVVTNVLIIIFA